jgi:coatomer protein complex subunit gamma
MPFTPVSHLTRFFLISLLLFPPLPAPQTAVFDALGLAPCEGTGAVKAGTNKHSALLAGVFLGGVKVLARLLVTLDAETGCVLKLAVRADDRDVAELLMGSIS